MFGVDRTPDHARVVTGGKPTGDRGYFYEPRVIADLAQGDELIKTEVFGPVITVQKLRDEDEAVALSTDSESALASSVWTTDGGTAVRMASRLDFGCVWINCHIPLQAEMPHGRFKHSGYGKDLSRSTGWRTTPGSNRAVLEALCAIARKRKDRREGTHWDPLLPLLSERAAPIPEGAIQPHHHTHLGHDQEK
jgi:acyl-CoA reductase-like NAD-dependent aldehyde dehydrogenase